MLRHLILHYLQADKDLQAGKGSGAERTKPLRPQARREEAAKRQQIIREYIMMNVKKSAEPGVGPPGSIPSRLPNVHAVAYTHWRLPAVAQLPASACLHSGEGFASHITRPRSELAASNCSF